MKKSLTMMLLLGALFAVAVRAQPQETGKTHVILLDVSGSMNQRYANNVRGWLVQPLLRSGAFSPQDRVIVRWFDQSASTAFDPNDPKRKVKNAPYSEQLVLDNIPTIKDAGGKCTDIPQALDLTLSDLDGYNVTGDVLVWIVTDNVQDACSGSNLRDIVPFYRKIADNQGRLFHSAHLFPLGRENGAALDPQKNALILYLLHYAKDNKRLGLGDVSELARQAAARIDNPVVTWLPFEKTLVPDPSPLTDETVRFEDDTLILPNVTEGVPPSFRFGFRFKSRARQRTVSGKIRNESLSLDLPAFLSVEGGEAAALAPTEEAAGGESRPVEEVSEAGALVKWDVQISPKLVSLAPEGAANQDYEVVMSYPSALKPASFWSAVFDSTSAPVTGTLAFELADITSEVKFDNPALEQVRNGGLIKDIVQQSVERPKPFQIPVQFQVAYNSAWRRLAVGLGGFFVLALGLALLLLFTVKTRYELAGPGGERSLALPLFGSEYVTIGPSRAAVITRRAGRLSVAPLHGHTVDGGRAARPLTGNNDSFTVESQEDGRSYPHTFRRATRAVNVAAKRDTFLD